MRTKRKRNMRIDVTLVRELLTGRSPIEVTARFMGW